MPARRRRVGSENDNSDSFVVVNGPNHTWNANTEHPEHQQSSIAITNQSVYQDIIDMTTSRDRTSEFSSAVQSILSKNVSRIVSAKDTRKAKYIQSHSEFMRVAKVVGKNIGNTYAKLEKLTLLAKQNSLFNDRTPEIHELTYMIKGDLNSLNEQIARLQDVSKSSYATGKHLKTHNNSVLLALQSKLASMSTDFKQILEVRTENLKQQKSRRDQFSLSAAPVTNSLPPSVTAGAYQGSVLLQEDDHVSINLDAMSGPGPGNSMVPFSHQQQQQQQLLYQDETDNYLQSRAETMQNIESTIVELGGIFQQLAHMVKEQEEMVERIDTNILDAELNIEAAHTQLLKYFQSVSSNRWLMIKVFGILILFFLFFIIFLT